MVIRQAKILAFRFFCGAQAVSRRFQSGVGFGELAEGEHDASQHVLGKVVKEIALVFAAVEPPQQLMPALCTAVTEPGGVACGNSGSPRCSAAHSSIGPNFTERLHWEQGNGVMPSR